LFFPAIDGKKQKHNRDLKVAFVTACLARGLNIESRSGMRENHKQGVNARFNFNQISYELASRDISLQKTYNKP
jgi:hypothetical protein